MDIKKVDKKKVLGIGSVVIVLIAVFLAFTGIGQPKAKTDTKTAEETAASKAAAKEKAAKDKLLATLPDVFSTDWNLVLVNSDHPFDEAKNEVNLVAMQNPSYEVDAIANEPYNQMFTAANEAGINLTVMSAYRSVAQQEENFNTTVQEHLDAGDSQEEAEKKTLEYVTRPGYSEHHTGLAIDVVDDTWYITGQGLVAGFGDTDAAKWLATNCTNYGFIIRYPKDKTEITKISYEPWHLRYVGVENAKYMKEHNLALEEYLALLEEAEK